MTKPTDPTMRSASRRGGPEVPRSPAPPPPRRIDFQRDVVALLGLPFDVMNLDQAVARVREAAFTRTRCFISTPNLNFVVGAVRDETFRGSVLRSDLSLCDGMPLVWMAKMLRLPIRERVPGASVFEALRRHPGPPITVYFFGGPPGAAEAASANVNGFGTGLRCVGFATPPFGDDIEAISTEEQIAHINDSGAQFVVVSLGARKGQAWIERNAPLLRAPVLCHLGAVVNFAAGYLRRAPEWMQSSGLEWAWRVKEEPGLWRRYATDAFSSLRLGAAALPGFLWRRTHFESLPAATLARTVSGHRTIVHLGGAWSRERLEPLRAALHEAAAGEQEVDIDLKGVCAVDAAFVGLVLLAHGHWGGESGGLRVVGASRGVRRTFQRLGAGYACMPSHPHARREFVASSIS